MNAALLKRHPRRSLAAAALLVLAGYAAMIRWHAAAGAGPLPDWTLAVDVLIVLPLLAWWLQPAPRGRGALLVALAVAMAGIWAGAWLLPDEDQQVWRWLEPLRWGVIGVLIVLQLAVAAMVLRPLAALLRQRARALRRGEAPGPRLEDELHTLLDAQAARVAHLTGRAPGAAQPWLRLEARLWLYALAPQRWLDAPPPAGEQVFGVHRQGQNLSNQLGFVVLAAVEIPLMHVLLHLWVGPWVAAVVTALSAYGLLFLWAEARATRWRRVGLRDGTLHVRHGLIDDLVLPTADIASATPHRGPAPRRAGDRLRCVGMGRANVHLVLRPGTRLATLTGERALHEIFLGVDEPERLLRALAVSGATSA